jgi:hypothetical protein
MSSPLLALSVSPLPADTPVDTDMTAAEAPLEALDLPPAHAAKSSVNLHLADVPDEAVAMAADADTAQADEAPLITDVVKNKVQLFALKPPDQWEARGIGLAELVSYPVDAEEQVSSDDEPLVGGATDKVRCTLSLPTGHTQPYNLRQSYPT